MELILQIVKISDCNQVGLIYKLFRLFAIVNVRIMVPRLFQVGALCGSLVRVPVVNESLELLLR